MKYYLDISSGTIKKVDYDYHKTVSRYWKEQENIKRYMFDTKDAAKQYLIGYLSSNGSTVGYQGTYELQ